MKRIVHLFLVLAFICMANLHLPVFQVVAWAGMLAKYSQNVSLRDAVEMTFNGDNPCDMCTAIKKQQESDTSTLKALPQIAQPLLFLEPPVVWIQSMFSFGAVTELRENASLFLQPPEHTPPRTFV